jgi:hypothetical protein
MLPVRAPRHTVALAAVTLAVILANLPVIGGWVTTSPVQMFSGLAYHAGHQLLPGSPMLDPNAGYITQSLGHRSLLDWMEGRVPWWNPYEGLGAPLAGEMQAASFFPLIALLTGAGGFAAFHVALEMVAGWATYFLLRRLQVGQAAATAGAVAMGLCGTLAWFEHAAANPIPFLPLALLGVERARAAAAAGHRGGWRLLAVAVALSVAAGFPEVAYLDGLLVASWSLVRLFTLPERRLAMAGRLASGAVMGVALAAPVLVAFADYLPHAYVGGHSGQLATASQPLRYLGQLLLPYATGPLDAYANPPGTVGILAYITSGGYLGVGVSVGAALGVAGIARGPHRALRVLAAGWLAVWLAKAFGAAPVVAAVNALPGMHAVFSARFALPGCEMAAVILAALGIDDLARRRVPAVTAGVVAALALTAVAGAGSEAASLLATARDAGRQLWPAPSAAAGGVTTVVILAPVVAARRGGGRRGALPQGRGTGPAPARAASVAAALTALEAVALAAIPLLSAPAPAPVDTALVGYLQAHAGGSRVFTLGPLQPNFGSYYGISELNVNDLPIPTLFGQQVRRRLDPQADPLLFIGHPMGPTAVTPAQALTSRLGAYEADGVGYVVTYRGAWPPPSLTPRPPLVYRDGLASVYRLAGAAPLITAGPHCRMRASTGSGARVACRSAGRLVRRQLWMPGWTATVNGRPAPVGRLGAFQAVTLDPGLSTVRFRFVPPGGREALGAALVALLALVAGTIGGRRRGSSAAPGREEATPALLDTRGPPVSVPRLHRRVGRRLP